MFISYPVKCANRQSIGDAVVKLLNDIERETGHAPRVIAVVPRMTSFFAMSPERHEVTEADVLLGE